MHVRRDIDGDLYQITTNASIPLVAARTFSVLNEIVPVCFEVLSREHNKYIDIHYNLCSTTKEKYEDVYVDR